MEEGGEIPKEPMAEAEAKQVGEPENPITSKKSVGGALPIIGGLMHLWNQIFGGGGAIDNPNQYNPELGAPATPISREVQEGINNPAQALQNRQAADKTATATHQIDITESQKAIDAQMRDNAAWEKEQLDKANQNMLGHQGEKQSSTPTPIPKAP